MSVAAHYEDRPRVSDVLGDLEISVVGSELIELLRKCEDVMTKAAKRRQPFVLGMRQRDFRLSPEELLAEQLLNVLGPPEDCFVMRELAEAEAAR